MVFPPLGVLCTEGALQHPVLPCSSPASSEARPRCWGHAGCPGLQKPPSSQNDLSPFQTLHGAPKIQAKGCRWGPITDPSPALPSVAGDLQQNSHSSPARFIFKHPFGKHE